MTVAYLHPKRLIPILGIPGLLVLGILTFGNNASAANSVWSTSTTGTTWNAAGDWATGGIPSGNTVEFGATATNGTLFNDISSLTITGFQFDAGAAAYTINGNAIILNGNITNSSTNLETINTPLTITASRTPTMTAGGGNITLGGNIGGTGGQLTAVTTGTLTLSGSNSYTGASAAVGGNPSIAISTLIGTNGTLAVGNNYALGTGALEFSGVGTLIAASPVTIPNTITNNNLNWAIGGNNNITLSGSTQWGGTSTVTINNTGTTTFSGVTAIRLSSASTRTVTYQGSGTIVISGPIINGISGATGSITYAGTGLFDLTGSNTYTGATTIENGGTALLDFSATGAPGTNIINNAANSSGLVLGAQGLGGGTLIIKGASGATNSQQFPTLTLGAGTPSVIQVVQNGATAVNVTLGTITRGAAATMDVTLPTTGSITATVPGNDGANSIVSSGPTTGVAFATANGGTTWLTSSGGTLGALASGSFQLNSFSSATGDTDIQTSLAPSAFTVNTIRFSTGGNTLTLNSSGASDVTSGGILVTPSAAGSVIASGGGSAVLRGGLGGVLVFHDYSSLTVSANIPQFASNGTTNTSVVNTGTGVTILSGTDSQGGTLTVSEGTLKFAKEVSLYNDVTSNWTAGNITVGDGATLALNVGGAGEFTSSDIATISALGSAATNGFVSGALLGLDPTDASSGTFTYSGNLANPFAGANSLGISKLGSNTLTLSGSNTYSGKTFVNSGTLQLAKENALYSDSNAFWTASNINVSSGAVLAFNVGGTGEFTSADLTTLAGAFAAGTAANGLKNGATLGLDTTDAGGNFTFGGVFANTNGGVNAINLTKLGAGGLTLTGTNTYTGLTTVSSGTLALGANNALGGGGALTINGAGATFDLGANHTDTLGTVTLANGNLIGEGSSILTSTASYQMQSGSSDAVLAGAVALTKSTAGTVTLTGASTYSGATNLNGGVLQISAANDIGNGSATNVINFNGGALESTASGYDLGVNRAITLNGAGTVQSDSGTLTVSGTVNTGASTLTVTGAGNTNITGNIGGGGALTKNGGGALTLAGSDSFTGATTVSNGSVSVNGSLGAGSTVTLSAAGSNNTVLLGGTGAIYGPVILSTPGGSNCFTEIVGGTLATSGTLTLANGLTLNAGSVAAFNNGGYINITGGTFSVASGAIIQVSQGLAAGVYPLIGFVGTAPATNLFTIDYNASTGTPAAGTYSLTDTNGVLDLNVVNATSAQPTISINAPLNGTRAMTGQTLSVTGSIGNTGSVQFNANLADNGGALTVTGTAFAPGNPNPIVVGTSQSVAYNGSINTGATLGVNTLSLIVSDTTVSPTLVATATSTVDVVTNRVVTASTVSSFGVVHVGATVSGTTNLTSTGSDNLYTRVTVANAGADANGISVTGGNTGNVFNGSTSDTRTVSGAISTLGPINGAITLVTGSEGLAGETPINVTVNYSAQVFSGKAAWSGTGGGTSWATNGNWGDTQAGDLGGAGAPGVSGALSIGDTATFGDFVGESATGTTVTIDGASPTLAALTFSGTGTSYTILPGTGGGIALQGTATPISITGSNTIAVGLSGNAGIKVSGSGVLVLAVASGYTGATTIGSGAVQLTAANNDLPTATNLTLGDAVANTSGQLILGDSAARNQTVASITAAGTGNANSVVGFASANSTLTVNYATTATPDVYSGALGGPGTNQNDLALTKSGAGVLALTGSNSYSGPTTLSAGTLNLGSAYALGNTSSISFGGGTLQWSAANTTDYSSLFSTASGQAYNFDTNGQTVTLASAIGGSGNNGSLTKTGSGTLILTALPTYTGQTTINNGVLVAPGLLTSSSKLNLSGAILNFGIFQVNSATPTTYSPTLGTNLTWSVFGGFAAQGSPLTINANGGAELFWNTAGFAAGSGGTPGIVFGSATANNQVILDNGFDFGTTTATLSDPFNRAIDVEGSPATIVGGTSGYGVTGGSALLAGVVAANTAVSGSTTNTGAPTGGDLGLNGFDKTGPGTLILSASNTYSGITDIVAGTVIAATNALSGTAGAFGDGHTVTFVQNSGTVNNVGSQSVVLGFANVNGSDGTAATNASPTVLIGGPYTVQVPITISTIATTGTYGIGGSTDNASTFAGTITTGESFNITQVANTGNNGSLNITGNITGAVGVTTAKTITFANAGNVNVSGNIFAGTGNGSFNVTQSGTGITTISSTVGYTGTTSVNAGTLIVSGGLAGTSVVKVASGGELNVNGSVNTSATISDSGILSGAGTVGNVTVLSGGTISPGSNLGGHGIGSITAGNIQLQGGGIYKLELNNDGSTGSAGTNWDQLYFNTLDLSSATLATTPFVLSLQTLDGSGNNNPLASFDPTQSHTWVSVLNFLSINGTYSAADFSVNSANFLNATNGGTFSVVLDTASEPSYETLDLVFTPVPEPGTWAMMLGGLGMLIGIQRIRRRKP